MARHALKDVSYALEVVRRVYRDLPPGALRERVAGHMLRIAEVMRAIVESESAGLKSRKAERATPSAERGPREVGGGRVWRN